MKTVIDDPVIEGPRRFVREHFRGRVTLAYDARPGDSNLFEHCEFEGVGRGPGNYNIYVPPGRRPRARFEGGRCHGGDKLIVAGFVGIFGMELFDAEDGFILGAQGYAHCEGGRTHSLGGQFGDHADAFQAFAGSNLRIRGWRCEMQGGNACVMLSTRGGPVSNVSIEGSLLDGGNYHIYARDDDHGPVRNVSVSGCHGLNPLFGPVSFDPRSRPSFGKNTGSLARFNVAPVGRGPMGADERADS